ncbi:MAG: hypothetical protein PWP38_1979 [Clostridiales bacterium]|nr:hypothetical protein [Clostridiales bacterium]
MLILVNTLCLTVFGMYLKDRVMVKTIRSDFSEYQWWPLALIVIDVGLFAKLNINIGIAETIKTWLQMGVNWLLIGGVITYMIRQLWYRRNRQLVETRNFYKIFKFIFTQINAGATNYQIFKLLYKVVDDAKMSRHLLRFSILLSQNAQMQEAIAYLRNVYKNDEGSIFVGILDNISQNHLTANGLINVDQMLFQKYLSGIRAETKRIERNYVLLVVMYTLLMTIFLLLPLISSMAESAQNIFS